MNRILVDVEFRGNSLQAELFDGDVGLLYIKKDGRVVKRIAIVSGDTDIVRVEPEPI